MNFSELNNVLELIISVITLAKTIRELISNLSDSILKKRK